MMNHRTSVLLLYLLFIVLFTGTRAQDQFHIRYAITENQPQDMRIGTLNEDLLQMSEVRSTELYGLLRNPTFGLLHYQLREPSHYFRLHELTSTLTTSVTIDLEALCPRFCKDGSPRALLTLLVNLLHGTRVVAVVFVEVTVIDVDDNPPHFPTTIPRPFVLQFKEVIYRQGQQVELPKAIDLDVQADHAEIAYRLEPHPEDTANSTEVFQLAPRRDDSRLMMILRQELDYEKVKLYRFYLVAWSPSLEQRTQKLYLNAPQPNFQDRLEIIVQVLNINDIEPVFPQPVYRVNVLESVPIGTTVFTLHAIDRDEDATIVYSLDGNPEPPSVTQPICVEADGRVLVCHQLDYEKRTRYEFQVRASDGEFYALTRLELHVTDVNDEAPEFVTSPRRLEVEENTPERTLVGQLFIIDRDSPEVNGQITCHEPKPLANQQPLVFVLENSAPESDLERRGLASPSVSSTSVENQVYLRFALYTRSEFDRETPPPVRHSLLVCSDGAAETQGSRRMTSTLTVELMIRDQNDNPPMFEKVLYEAELNENCPIGTRVIQVHATDADSEPHAIPKYQLQRNELFGAHFDIEPETGWVFTKLNIDRETQPLYQLTVWAIDGHVDSTNGTNHPLSPPTTQHTATAHIHIRVTDENDNAPEFRGPRQFAVEENQPASKWIGDLQALDRDDGMNREVEFEISAKRGKTGLDHQNQNQNQSNNQANKSGTGFLPIALSKNGSLYTTANLDRENQSHYCFEVIARDRSPVKPLSSVDTICVRVLDLNDNAPVIMSIRGSTIDGNDTMATGPNTATSEFKIYVSVHETPGYCALIVEASDADEGRNALLQYGIRPTTAANHSMAVLQPDTFLMDTQTGRLMLSRHIHFREIGTYPFVVRVEDSGNPPLSVEKTIDLIIEDRPARGNWLLPETERRLTSAGNGATDLNEIHTILIVVGLAGVSAVLAAALISAILCMIRPCCRTGAAANGPGQAKPTRKTQPTVKCHTELGPLFADRDPRDGYNDYHGLAVLTGNGYIDAVDESVGMPTQNMLLTSNTLSTINSTNGVTAAGATPLPGFENVYLPADKVLGIESAHVNGASGEDASCCGGSAHCSAMVGRPTSFAVSPNGLTGLFQCPIQAGWIHDGAPHSFWTQLTANGLSTIQPGYGDCQILLGPESLQSDAHLVGDSSQVPTSSQALPLHTVSSSVPNQCFSPHKPSFTASPGGRSNQVVVDLMLNGERHGSGEEQRSDSGRGASDEEVPSLCFGGTGPVHGPNSGRKQFHSVTLRTMQERHVPPAQGIVFPSLPRLNLGNIRTGEKRLTTFERISTPPVVDMKPPSDAPQTPRRRPSIVRLPNQAVQ